MILVYWPFVTYYSTSWSLIRGIYWLTGIDDITGNDIDLLTRPSPLSQLLWWRIRYGLLYVCGNTMAEAILAERKTNVAPTFNSDLRSLIVDVATDYSVACDTDLIVLRMPVRPRYYGVAGSIITMWYSIDAIGPWTYSYFDDPANDLDQCWLWPTLLCNDGDWLLLLPYDLQPVWKAIIIGVPNRWRDDIVVCIEKALTIILLISNEIF